MAVAGCLQLPTAERGAAPREIALRDGMRVRAPEGKCVDTTRVRQENGQATVVLANCSNVGGSPEIGKFDPGLILVTVVRGSHGDLSTLHEDVTRDPGLLARSGQGADIQILALRRSRAALYANVIDISPGTPRGVSPQHWKAALDVAGRAVVVSVFGRADGPLPSNSGEALARDVAQALLDANAAPLPVRVAEPTQAPPETTAETAAGRFLSGLFGGS